MEKTAERFQDLLDLIHTLRGPEGCPWDRKQTIETLTKYVHQEFQEFSDALAAGSPAKIQEEMGDLIFLLLFLAEISREKGQFSIDDVFEQVKEKMVGRHPHVFGDATVNSVEDVKDNWKIIKAQEKLRAARQTMAEKMPRNLTVLQQALWVVRAARNEGAISDDPKESVVTIERKGAALRVAVADGDREKAGSLLGDLFFSLVTVSRLLDVKPETALTETLHHVLQHLQKKTVEA